MGFPCTLRGISLRDEAEILFLLQQALGYDFWSTAKSWYHQNPDGAYRSLDLTVVFRTAEDRDRAGPLIARYQSV